MTADRFRTIEERGGCVDLSGRAKFRLTGADRVRYLNGQVTNDARKASSTSALHACVVNAKGRIEGDIFIHASPEGDALLIDAEADLREAIGTRLERYIVADDVTLEDVTDEWGILHVFGAAVDHARRTADWMDVSRFDLKGVELWSRLNGQTVSAPAPYLSPEEVEALRIVRGIPQWPQELNPDAFPQEAGLEAKVMDFAKGCYIGQEVLSRIKMTGKMPRRLVRVTVHGSAFPIEPGMKLMTGDDSASVKEAGTITSVVRHPLLDQWVGLAYVRQSFEAVDSLLLASGDPPRILGDVKITRL